MDVQKIVFMRMVVFQMFEWIIHNRELFLVNYTEIGRNHGMAAEMQAEHSHFAMNSMVRKYFCYCVPTFFYLNIYSKNV